MFGWWSNRKAAEIVEELRRLSGGDLLALTPEEVAMTLLRHAVKRPHNFLRHLYAAAIDCDVRRMLSTFSASGYGTMPPARLAADWASALGLDDATIASVVAKSASPVSLAQAYLRRSPIGVRELSELEDVATAYGAPRERALRWIEMAVDGEIEAQVERYRSEESSQGGSSILAI